MLSSLRLYFAGLCNRFKRKQGVPLHDQCAIVVMRMCTLQLKRGEKKELAPTQGASGPMLLSGGAITTIQYSVFDKNADRVNPEIKKEPWRAFSTVKMMITVERDPEFEVYIDGLLVDAKPLHKTPGLDLLKNLSTYFPLLPAAYVGPTYKPAMIEGLV